MNNLNIEVPKITRFEVIDHRDAAPIFGRVFSVHNVAINLSLQDGGRTLKVFLVNDALRNSKLPSPGLHHDHKFVGRPDGGRDGSGTLM
jgi:hypothetical protein